MNKPRILQKLYANLCGYFWLPCPLCGEMFGGHEWKSSERGDDSIMTSWNSGTGVCPNCHGVAKKYNEQWMKDNPHPGYLMRE